MLENRQTVHQALKEVQQATLKEESKKAERMTLNNYNRALVQNMCTHMIAYGHPRPQCEHLKDNPVGFGAVADSSHVGF